MRITRIEDMNADVGNCPPETDVIGSIREKRVYIRTYGCTYNTGDTQKLEEVLKHQRCSLVDDPADADVVIVNTCTVIGLTERKILRELRILQNHPLYVTGCMAVVSKEVILSQSNARVFPPEEIRAAYRRIGTVTGRPIGIVQVCHGCRGACSYCITKNARGWLTSYAVEEIARQIQALVMQGAVEIQMTGQDLSAWGMDIGLNLGHLLSEINSIPGHYRVRVGMMNPATLHPIMDSVAGAFVGQKVFSLIHIPVQSGSDEILSRMNRGYTREKVIDIVRRFREHIPDLSLFTDVICGYPGETEEDFLETLGLLSVLQPDKVNVTRYSRRSGTSAALEKDMPDRFKKERSRILRIHAEAIARKKNACLIGREIPVLFTEHPRKGSSMGRTAQYTGVVVPGHHEPGTIKRVRLTEDRIYYFLGEIV